MPTPIPTGALTVTLTEALDDLTNAYTVAGRSPHTTSLFTLYVGKMIDFLADDGVIDIDNVTTAHLTRFLAHERQRGMKPASLSVTLRTLRRFFQWSVEQGHITANPARKVLAPRVIVEPPRFLSDDEITVLLASIARDKTVEGIRDIALIRILMDTGLRRSEAMGLRVTDLSDDHSLITVRAATSKMRRGRIVPISKQTAQAVKTYLRVRAAFLTRTKRQDDDVLWISSRGNLSPNGGLQALRRRLAAAGLPQVTMHSLRHGWAAGLVQDGMQMTYLMNLGGWSSPAMPTARYGQYLVGDRAVEAMKARLNR